MALVGVIGGTGVYDPGILENISEHIQSTPYGEVKVLLGYYRGQQVAFIPRHGSGHKVPPHLVNYRANIKALHDIGVKSIIATAAVGSLTHDFQPGSFVLSDQFLDFTRTRKSTFYEGDNDAGVVHCDMTVPYCPEVRQALVKAGEELGVKVHNGGTYVCTEGPRFETAAEIAMFKQLGGHLIGMTSVPEVCLARELGLCYANISIVTNYAAGISPNILTHSEVLEMMASRIQQLREVIMTSIKYIPAEPGCDCKRILDEIGVMGK
ncbi:MAG TPA: S-methyl-5'-thioadenosine phosphorylase [Syntrophomonadaceae bacterium]|nr:S-methyl-5'-thioadenosine phosphorylase [Syntrophomonadaceae bacterium]HOQ08767.1 S-methyl-5'-thioadenosine phosphorylase [Syntrophomonadaceae bacterium]HPU47813.1 S-methyl-5'-thioadenosine phosphorylase [Syntrophomonadaceae bacterium]